MKVTVEWSDTRGHEYYYDASAIPRIGEKISILGSTFLVTDVIYYPEYKGVRVLTTPVSTETVQPFEPSA